MKVLNERRGVGFEIQLYDDNGNYGSALQTDSIEEMSRFLSNLLWSSQGMSYNPTVWKDGAPWR